MVGHKHFERNMQMYNEIHKNNVSYIERPQYSSKCESNLNINFSRYMTNGKASLGYNNFKNENNKIDNKIDKKIDNKIDNKINNQNKNLKKKYLNESILPPNIYHNFSEYTRLKKHTINYDINRGNTYTN